MILLKPVGKPRSVDQLPFFDINVDTGLLVEPIIVRLPLFVGVRKADVKKLEDVRN